MKISENPNYSFTDRPFKDKYICVDCRKCFKRRVLDDVSGETVEKDPKCPDCGIKTFWIGPKFRAPKSDNLKAWNSLKVLQDIGVLSFFGFAHQAISLPETNKGLNDMLLEMRQSCQQSIRKYISSKHNATNKLQIAYLSDVMNKIDQHLKTRGA